MGDWKPRPLIKRAECSRYTRTSGCLNYCEIEESVICCLDCDRLSLCHAAMRTCKYVTDPFPPQSYSPGKPFRIIIPGIPRTKKNNPEVSRGRAGKYGGGRKIHYRVSAKNREYVKMCAPYLEHYNVGIDAPLNIKAVYYRPARGKVDLCNLHAALHDALVFYGVIVDDDCTVIVSTDGSRVEWDKDDPRTEVTIETLPDSERPWTLNRDGSRKRRPRKKKS